MSAELLAEILKLGVEDRIRLAQDIWDSVVDEIDFPLDDEQQAELARRLADARANPGVGRSWAEVKARLTARQ
jgi:putative addiction module component (TIGR02574 family)